MIHRFVDLPPTRVRLPDIPVLGTDVNPIGTHTIWQIGNQATPVRMAQTAISITGTGTPHLADPHREPVTGDYVVYSRYNVTGTINRSVRLVDWADTTDIQLYADGAGGAGGSLQPVWSPDASKIMFRAVGGGGGMNLIKRMDPDGTNVQTIYTGAGNVFDPVFNFDGTRIAWQEANTIKSANADGTGLATIFTAGVGTTLGFAVAYQRGGNKLAFRHTVGTDEIWKTINDDGTGVATWLTISRTGYGPGQGNPTPIMYSWLENDTDIVSTVRVPADPDPDARLALISSGGSSFISPARYASADTGSPDNRPVAISGMAEGVERLYWMETAFVEVSSVLPDGSDYRVDWDGAGIHANGSRFHGFRGDTQNV